MQLFPRGDLICSRVPSDNYSDRQGMTLKISSKYLAPKAEIPHTVFILSGTFAFIVLVTGWSVLSYGGYVQPHFLPTPGKVVDAAIKMAVDGELFKHIYISVYRVVMGFLLAAVIGVPLGILMGSLRIVEGLFEPIIGFIRYLPASAFIPLFILWIGLGEAEKIAVIFFGTFFQMVLMVMDVTKNVPTELIDVAYTLGATRFSVFRKVILPASLPGIVDTLRITFGWAWTYLVVAEIVGALSGLGFMIMQASRFLASEKILVGIIVIGLLGMITDLLFKGLYNIMFPWLRRG